MLTLSTPARRRGRPRGMSRSPSRAVFRSRKTLADHAFRLLFRVVPRAGLENPAGADPVKLRRFIDHASRLYHDNPYHTWEHAVDVAHTAAWLVMRPVFRRALAPSDVFWLLIAALVHDLDHPGHTNAWEMAQHSERAIQYEGNAVLERHSLGMALSLLDVPECRFIDTMPDRIRARGRTLLRDLILATDFSVHTAFVAKLDEAVDRYPSEIGFDQPDFALLILQALMKAADIGNVTKPHAIARMWAERAMAEFRAQGRKEREAGLPVPPINDETRTGLVQAQVGFIQFVALDLFGLLSRVEPEIRILLRALCDNLARYQAIARASGGEFRPAISHPAAPAYGADTAVERHAS